HRRLPPLHRGVDDAFGRQPPVRQRFYLRSQRGRAVRGTGLCMTKHDKVNVMSGTIVAAHGRHYLADVDGEFLQCVTRGKKTNVAVGDIVHLKRTSNDQAVIEKIAERTTLLYRSDQYKS